jgi:hypothetical protein
MAQYTLRLLRDRLDGGASVSLPALNRVLYVADGMAMVSGDGVQATLSANSGWFSAQEVQVTAGGQGAEILRYELSAGDQGGDAASEMVLEPELDLEPGAGYLMRCDRVDLPPAAIAYTHTHQGPGIRCLLNGGFNVEVAGQTTTIAAGEAWFEAGPDAVLAWAPDDAPGEFSRVMILPRSLKGLSSLRYVVEDDGDKPKLQKYTIFVDTFIHI